MRFPIPKPALIHSKFLTALQGAGGKMSSSNPNSAIFMSDTPKMIKDKINKHAFSGGRETAEEHREKGGNPDVDVAYQYLTYFEDDDAKLEKLAKEYRAGTLMTGEMKKECIDLLQGYVAAYQDRRSQITDETMKEFMRPRFLEWRGNPNKPHPLEKLEKARSEKAERARLEKEKAEKAAEAKKRKLEERAKKMAENVKNRPGGGAKGKIEKGESSEKPQ
jgi:tryptophanyl-tRNA synthetase